jgi:hypothetical protein
MIFALINVIKKMKNNMINYFFLKGGYNDGVNVKTVLYERI